MFISATHEIRKICYSYLKSDNTKAVSKDMEIECMTFHDIIFIIAPTRAFVENIMMHLFIIK